MTASPVARKRLAIGCLVIVGAVCVAVLLRQLRRVTARSALPSDATAVDEVTETLEGMEGDYSYCLCARARKEALEPFAKKLRLAPSHLLPDAGNHGPLVDYMCPSTGAPTCWRQPPPLSESFVAVDRGFVQIAGWRDGVLYYSSSHQ